MTHSLQKIEKEKNENSIEDVWTPGMGSERGEMRGKRKLRKDQEKQKGTDQGEEKKCKQYAVLP